MFIQSILQPSNMAKSLALLAVERNEWVLVCFVGKGICKVRVICLMFVIFPYVIEQVIIFKRFVNSWIRIDSWMFPLVFKIHTYSQRSFVKCYARLRQSFGIANFMQNSLRKLFFWVPNHDKFNNFHYLNYEVVKEIPHNFPQT